jgi:hypothetical protein
LHTLSKERKKKGSKAQVIEGRKLPGAGVVFWLYTVVEELAVMKA